MSAPDRSHALDHIVVVLFENRSLDNVLGHLYGPGDGRNFDGVIGKGLSNPIPAWAEHGAERKVVPYTVATDMDSPNPDSGEEYFHTNTQLFNIIEDQNRFKTGEAGWDEPGGTYDHVVPGPVPPPDPAAPAGECGFTFDRSGYRVPAIIVSPWVEPGSVYNEEYRHTSLIATLRKAWGLGEAFTQRDASARTFDHVFSLTTPRDPDTWAAINARPVPEWTMDPEVAGQALSTLGKSIAPALIARAREMGVPLPSELDDPEADLPPRLIVGALRQIAGHFFPLLTGDAKGAWPVRAGG